MTFGNRGSPPAAVTGALNGLFHCVLLVPMPTGMWGR